MGRQQIVGQVKPVPRRVLAQVAQDVGQLQGEAERCRQPVADLGPQAEDAAAQPSHGAGDPVAVLQQVGPGGEPQRFRRVRFHAVDDGLKIGLGQTEMGDRFGQGDGDRILGLPRIEGVDFVPPAGQFALFHVERIGVVGNVVDDAAEGVDREHGVPLLPRQEPHGPIEGRARGAHDRFDMFAGAADFGFGKGHKVVHGRYGYTGGCGQGQPPMTSSGDRARPPRRHRCAPSTRRPAPGRDVGRNRRSSGYRAARPRAAPAPPRADARKGAGSGNRRRP